jgi:hypothetical protein
MPSGLGPIEITCDAPSYDVVEGCREFGFQSPMDVRWCRLSRFAGGHPGWRRLFSWHPFEALLGTGAGEPRCFCGEPLPALRRCWFPLFCEKETSYLLGQCHRCLTIFWEESRTG